MPTGSQLVTAKPMAPLAHTLMPASSFIHGANAFLQGECVLFRIPDLRFSETSTTHAASSLPPTSRGHSSQHFAFIRSAILCPDGSYDLVIYPVVSFSNQGGALAGHATLSPAQKPYFIPLSPLSSAHTPSGFGNPIYLGTFALDRPSWLALTPHRFIMPENRAVSPFFFNVNDLCHTDS